MQQFLTTLTPIAVVTVGIVLVLGLGNLLRANSANTSQKLMRWRVGIQFLAICVLLVVLFLRRS
ncbi:MAG: twin transmembrane helix small protein [Hyphomicrobiaceae bacterium]|nr:MAG: twin transmembrane helix small protein [Hyphomicrobiaceae bacterium]